MPLFKAILHLLPIQEFSRAIPIKHTGCYTDAGQRGKFL